MTLVAALQGEPHEPLLGVRDLRVSVSRAGSTRELVRGVSLEVDAGDAVAIVGRSGAGKTTLAHALLGLAPPGGRIAGSIRWRGRELVGEGEEAWRRVRGRGLGLVLQEPLVALDPVMRVGAQLVETIRAHEGVSAREARTRAGGVLEELGVARAEARLRAYPFELSGGERQRVLLALALVTSPELLVLDEPTSALDVPLREELAALLAGLRARRRLALLVVTHDLALLPGLAESVLVLEDGCVVERGPSARVLDAPESAAGRELVGARRGA